VSWRGERWADIVARAGTSERRPRAASEREDPAVLAARASAWTFESVGLSAAPDGLVLGAGMHTVEVAFAVLYHVEPVDPWPSLAVGWIDASVPYRAVLSPAEADADTFAERVASAIEACAQRVPRATARGWLDVPELAWEPVDAMPGEREEGPAMRGYRMAPEAPDPIVAKRTLAVGGPRLFTYIAARLRRPPRRVEPREVVLTRAFVHVRTSGGVKLRLPADTLRASRRTDDGDAVYVFGRNTELLLVHHEGCELTAALDARVPS
jgi:hypothetical protein